MSLAKFADSKETQESDDTGGSAAKFAPSSSNTLSGSTTLNMRIMNVETENKFGIPVVHLYCRGADRELQHVEVEGFQPSFLIKESDYTERLDNHFAVSGVASDSRTTIHGEPLKRVFCNTTDGAKDLQDMFD